MLSLGLVAAVLDAAVSEPISVRIMVPGGLDGYWAQKIAAFEAMKLAQGEEVKVLLDPVDSTVHFESAQAEIMGGTDMFDGFVIMASWLPDFVDLSDRGLKDLTDDVKQRVDLKWNDVLPFVRETLCSYDRRVYLVPVDLDMMYVHYREDLRTAAGLAVPNTWEKVLEFAAHYHGMDLNNDSIPDYGLCFPTAGGGYGSWNFMTVVTAYMQTQGTKSGAFFDKESMESLFRGEGFAEAIRTYAKTLKYTQNVDGTPRQPGEKAAHEGISLMGSVLPNQVSGRCALIYDWMASGTSSVLVGPWFGTSYVNNQVRSTLVGTSRVQHPETQALTPCDTDVCPFASDIDGELVNFAPYMAAGGLAAGINSKATERGQAVAFDLFAFMSVNSASFVNQQTAWVNPFRRSHLTADTWESAEYPLDTPAWTNYVTTIEAALDDPNACLDFRMPGYTKYFGALDSARMAFVTETDLDDTDSIEANVAVFQDSIATAWDSVTAETGVETAREFYRKSLGDYTYTNEEKMKCVPGEYFDEESFRCRDCKAGFASALAGQLSCTPCDEGHFSEAKASSCTPCSPGTHAPEKVAAQCAPCASGTYSDQLGAAVCTPCQKGFYNMEEGATGCTMCGDGKTMTTRSQGAADAAMCGCAEGFFCGDECASGTCTSCGAAPYDHFQCAGLFECAPLPALALAGDFPCPEHCVAGEEICATQCVVPILRARKVCEDPALGFSLNCDGWTLVDTDESAVRNGEEIVESNDRVYKLTEAELDALVGPRIEYPESATARLGTYPLVPTTHATAVLQVQHCHEAEASRLRVDTELPFNLEPKHAMPLAEAGYVTAALTGEELLLRKCSSELACPGGPPGTCSPGYERSAECTTCRAGFRQSALACTECTAGSVAPNVFLGLLVLAVPFTFFGLYRASNTPLYSRHTTLFGMVLALGSTVTWSQVLAGLGQLDISWPDDFKAIIKVCSLFLFDMDVLQFECIFQLDQLTKYFISVCGPMVLLLSYFGCFAASQAIPAYAMEWGPTVNSAGTIIQIAFIQIITIGATPWQKLVQPTGKDSVFKFPSIDFGTAEHDMMMAFGCIIMFGLALPFLAGSAYVISVAPERTVEDRNFLRSYRFIFSKYRDDCYSFHLTFLLRQFLIAVMPVLDANNPEVGAVGLLVVVCVFLVVQMYKWPWRVDDMNYLDCTMSCLMVLFIGCGLGLLDGPYAPIEAAVQVLAFVWVGTLAVVVLKHCYLMVKWKGALQSDESLERRAQATAQDWERTLALLSQCSVEEHKALFAEWAWYDLHAMEKLITFLTRDYAITGLTKRAGKRIRLETSELHASVRGHVADLSNDLSASMQQRASRGSLPKLLATDAVATVCKVESTKVSA